MISGDADAAGLTHKLSQHQNQKQHPRIEVTKSLSYWTQRDLLGSDSVNGHAIRHYMPGIHGEYDDHDDPCSFVCFGGV